MATLVPRVKKNLKPPSVRRQVDRKILRFSVMIGLVAALLTALVCFAAAYPSMRRWRDINLRTLSQINCSGGTCDTGKFSTRWDPEAADYVLYTENRYFVTALDFSLAGPQRFRPLHYAKTPFIGQFRQPRSHTSVDQEVWRLYSPPANVGGKKFEVMVGFAEKAPWKMIDTPASAIGAVDAKLKRQADEIAAHLASLRAAIPKGRGGLSADGYQVVDAETEEIVECSWLPAYLPDDKPLPAPGWSLYASVLSRKYLYN